LLIGYPNWEIVVALGSFGALVIRDDETHQAGTDTAYDGLSNGDDLAGVYIQHAFPVVQQQLLNAGIRLAKIIDENF